MLICLYLRSARRGNANSLYLHSASWEKKMVLQRGGRQQGLRLLQRVLHLFPVPLPLRFRFLIFLDKLPLHDLQPTHFLLHIFQLIIQHEAFLVQIGLCRLPALVVDLLTVILAATQDRCRLSVLAQFILILSFKATALCLRQLLPCAVMLYFFHFS